jgi:hypothetical protein
MDTSNKLETPKREAWLTIGRYAIPILLGLVVLSVLGIYLWPRPSRHPLEIACEKIEEGMLNEDAIDIVGRPPDHTGTAPGPAPATISYVWRDKEAI